MERKKDPLKIFQSLKKSEKEDGSYELQRYISRIQKKEAGIEKKSRWSSCCRRRKKDSKT